LEYALENAQKDVEVDQADMGFIEYYIKIMIPDK